MHRNQSLISAIYDRYSDVLLAPATHTGDTSGSSDAFSLSNGSSSAFFSSPSDSNSPMSDTSNSQPASSAFSPNEQCISFYIPTGYSPRKTQSGLVITMDSLVMSDQDITHVGDCDELARSCPNVLELDLAKNRIQSWDEIKNLLSHLKRLKLLNLSYNPLPGSMQRLRTFSGEDIDEDEDLFANNFVPPIEQTVAYFDSEWHLHNEANRFDQLRILILNFCCIDMQIVQSFLQRLLCLAELHLASNNYTRVTFSDDFVKPTLKILYFNNNNLTTWEECCKIGRSFPELETLVLSDNDITNFTSDNETLLSTSRCFSKLQTLIINTLKISEWSVIDQLREFSCLKHLRIHNIPLLDQYSEEEKYYLLVSHLEDSIQTLNGSEIKDDDRENCERTYVRHYLDAAFKPPRYFELEKKHGKLNKLAEVNLDVNKRVQVRIKFRDTNHYQQIDVRQTVGEFKKELEKLVGHPSHRFRLFYIDIEAMSIYGPEELKYPSRCLYSFNVRDGDEFEIDIKPPPLHHHTSIHSASESHFQTHHHHQPSAPQTNATKPLVIRNRKTPTEQNANEHCFYKKTKAGAQQLSSSATGGDSVLSPSSASTPSFIFGIGGLRSPHSGGKKQSKLDHNNENKNSGRLTSSSHKSSFNDFIMENKLLRMTAQSKRISEATATRDQGESETARTATIGTHTHELATSGSANKENPVVFTTGNEAD